MGQRAKFGGQVFSRGRQSRAIWMNGRDLRQEAQAFGFMLSESYATLQDAFADSEFFGLFRKIRRCTAPL